tara:strand:- start:688 stop:906 length:219 start_codon:yes stop_codon:yes gene_type:complete
VSINGLLVVVVELLLQDFHNLLVVLRLCRVVSVVVEQEAVPKQLRQTPNRQPEVVAVEIVVPVENRVDLVSS